MASDGTRGPKPYRQTVLKTIFIRVPEADWAAVRRGVKREFRAAIGKATLVWNVKPPTPVVLWTETSRGHESELAVLEAVNRERLGAITPEGLAAEGFDGKDAFARFRRYWMARERKRFQPTREVAVYRVRPWTPNDRHEMADKLLSRLYGGWLGEPEEVTSAEEDPQVAYDF